VSEERPGPIGMSFPVAPMLFERIIGHSPELVVHIQHYLEENGERLDQRVTNDGTDASARLTYLMAEVMLTFEKLRLELLDQTRPGVHRVPANLALAMNESLRLEPAILHMAKTSMQLHLYLWNAHELSKEDERSKKQQIQEAIGRWAVREAPSDE
jgi:hypothetical protein